MQLLTTIVLIVMSAPVVAFADPDRFIPCLPGGVTLQSEVVDDLPAARLDKETQNSKLQSKRKPKTVQSVLIEMKAQCRKGTLTARNGKGIRIVQLIGCWGNPPEDYQEQIDRQRKEIEKLKEKYVVIEVPCTASKTIAFVRYALACRDARCSSPTVKEGSIPIAHRCFDGALLDSRATAPGYCTERHDKLKHIGQPLQDFAYSPTSRRPIETRLTLLSSVIFFGALTGNHDE